MIMDEQSRAISLDVLAESLNLGLGHVIDELSEISNSRIELHVPEVNMLPKKEALAFTEQLRQEGKAIFVQQRFSGEICGEALLFFSERESLNLLNGLLGEQEQTLIEFAVTEEEMRCPSYWAFKSILNYRAVNTAISATLTTVAGCSMKRMT